MELPYVAGRVLSFEKRLFILDQGVRGGLTREVVISYSCTMYDMRLNEVIPSEGQYCFHFTCPLELKSCLRQASDTEKR